MLKAVVALLASVLVPLPVVAGAELPARPWTLIYDDPASPETSFFRISELPSFVFMPGAPIAVRYSRPTGSSLVGSSSGDLDCVDFSGPVQVAGYDPHHLDADGDGIGCE